MLNQIDDVNPRRTVRRLLLVIIWAIVCYIEHIEQILSLIFSWTGIRWITYSEMVKNQFSNCLENLFSPFNYQIVGLL